MSDCTFCDMVRGERAASRVYEDDATLAFMDMRQANDGHVLVIPKAHAVTIYDLDAEAASRLMQTVVKVAQAIRAALQPDGLTIWQSNGDAAGQVVPHVHIHLLPRRTGDAAFRFIPQGPPIHDRAALDRLAARIRDGLTS